MSIAYEYVESTENVLARLSSFEIKPDDRTIQFKCGFLVHYFAPSSSECVCGKHEFKKVSEACQDSA